MSKNKPRMGIYLFAGLVMILSLVPYEKSSLVNAQSETVPPAQQQQAPFGSKYMEISNVNVFQTGDAVSVGGVMENNSTNVTFNVPKVIAVLYGLDGRLITTNSDSSSFGFDIKPGEKTAFSMTINVPSGEIVSSYTLLPGGSASSFP